MNIFIRIFFYNNGGFHIENAFHFFFVLKMFKREKVYFITNQIWAYKNLQLLTYKFLSIDNDISYAENTVNSVHGCIANTKRLR